MFTCAVKNYHKHKLTPNYVPDDHREITLFMSLNSVFPTFIAFISMSTITVT